MLAVDYNLGLTDSVILPAPISRGSFYQLLAGRTTGDTLSISHPWSMTGSRHPVARPLTLSRLRRLERPPPLGRQHNY